MLDLSLIYKKAATRIDFYFAGKLLTAAAPSMDGNYQILKIFFNSGQFQIFVYLQPVDSYYLVYLVRFLDI